MAKELPGLTCSSRVTLARPCSAGTHTSGTSNKLRTIGSREGGKMPEERTLKEMQRKQEMGEFMTGPGPGLVGWSERRKGDLLGTFKSTHFVPQFRPFDLLTAPNQPLTILENASHRIGVEGVQGTQDAFHRYVDADIIYFQFSGSTQIESEFGV